MIKPNYLIVSQWLFLSFINYDNILIKKARTCESTDLLSLKEDISKYCQLTNI